MLLIMLILSGCEEEPEPQTGNVIIISNGVLTAHFVDNGVLSEYGDHPEGLNGIARLRHINQPEQDIFVPFLAGLNYETTALSGVEDTTWEQKAEPRYEPIYLNQVDDTTVELYQEPTTRKEIEALLQYTLKQNPPAVDFYFQFWLHRAPVFLAWQADFTALFASYMYDPQDPHLYFRGYTGGDLTPRWLRAAAEYHGSFWVEEAGGSGNYTNYYIHKPYFAGIVQNALFMIMLNPPENFRLWYSPTGGWNLDYNSPAWDLVITQDNVPGPPYYFSVNGRMLFIPGETVDNAQYHYEEWLEELTK